MTFLLKKVLLCRFNTMIMFIMYSLQYPKFMPLKEYTIQRKDLVNKIDLSIRMD